jgi:hypothetical protein
MTRALSRCHRLLATAALFTMVGCEADENRIPGDTKAGPVAPIFLFLDVRASRTSITAGETDRPIEITVQANFADTGKPVADGTEVTLSTTLGSFDAPGGSSTLALEMQSGLGNADFYPGATAGTARVRAELDGVTDSVEITIRPAGPAPEPAPVASTITLASAPTSASEEVASTDIELIAIVRGSDGEPFGGAGVNFTSEAGALDSGGSVLTSDSAGEVHDTLTVTGSELEGITSSSFTVTATLGVVGGTKSTSIEVLILRAEDPPVASTITLAATPIAVPEDDGDGGAAETVDLDAIVRDQLGELFGGASVQFTTELGSLASTFVTTSGSGLAENTLTLTEAELGAFPTDTFDVAATIGTANGNVSASVTLTIVRPSPEPLVADFAISANPDIFGDPIVEFTDLSSGSPSSWAWDLDGDGFADDAAVPNPTFDYSAFAPCAVVNVTLIVSDGTDTDSETKSLTVQPCP